MERAFVEGAKARNHRFLASYPMVFSKLGEIGPAKASGARGGMKTA